MTSLYHVAHSPHYIVTMNEGTPLNLRSREKPKDRRCAQSGVRCCSHCRCRQSVPALPSVRATLNANSIHFGARFAVSFHPSLPLSLSCALSVPSALEKERATHFMGGRPSPAALLARRSLIPFHSNAKPQRSAAKIAAQQGFSQLSEEPAVTGRQRLK